MFDPCEQRLLFQQCNCKTRYPSSNRYNFNESFVKYLRYIYNDLLFVINVSTNLARFSRHCVALIPFSQWREGDIMIIILDVGNRPIRVMDGDFKTEGDLVIPGRPLCRQPNFPAEG